MSDLFDWDDRKRLAAIYQQAADESSLEPATDTEKHYSGLIAVAAFAADEAERVYGASNPDREEQ